LRRRNPPDEHQRHLHGLTAGIPPHFDGEAIGIRMGDGKDQIRNQGAITATSDATATGLA